VFGLLAGFFTIYAAQNYAVSQSFGMKKKESNALEVSDHTTILEDEIHIDPDEIDDGKDNSPGLYPI